MNDDIVRRKTDLRRALKMRRAALDHASAKQAAAALTARFVADVDLPANATVAGFWPLDGELDPRPIMTALATRGHALALPVVVARGKPLQFRNWTAGDELIAAQYGLSEPPATSPEVRPDVLIVPLLGFDECGHRIGYGAGFYDMTLAQLRADGRSVLAVGIAFAWQLVPTLPVEPWDAALDLVVTDAATHDFRNNTMIGDVAA